VYGDITKGQPIVRIHSSCLFGEALHGLDCDCRQQLDATMKLIRRHGNGVVIYQFAEGRGIGIEEKIRALEIQRTQKVDTVEAFKIMNLPADLRNYDAPIGALNDIALANTVIFVSQNPNKIKAIEDAGYIIDEIRPPTVDITAHNMPELIAKKNKLGYLIDNVALT